jgi:UDP-glucose 4-epimerase
VRTLVTGGARFIGSNLVDALLARGDEVTILDDLSTGRLWLDQVAPSRIAHLVYGATREDAVAAVGADAHAGYLYVTSGSLPNPWQTVPDYLDEEEDQLAR